jgi:hypothetical protein
MRSLPDVLRIYQGSNGEATKALYSELEALGPLGIIGMNLFRACKCSERAKGYRHHRFKGDAYARKDWSIKLLAEAMHADVLFRFGWGIDAALQVRGDPHHHILYVDIPTGQVSFHNGARYEGPDYPGEWDGMPGQGPDRICRWVAKLLEGSNG